MQTRRWNKLNFPGITSIVGAGGKSTVIQKLLEYGLFEGAPMMVTATTEMLKKQVDHLRPYYGDSFNDAEESCAKAIRKGTCGAWFANVVQDKVTGVNVKDIDYLHKLHPDWHIIVEADIADRKWVKVPKNNEPFVPSLTNMTIGVLNLQALGMAMQDEYIYNMNAVTKIVERPAGAVITPSMLGKIVMHRHGMFQHCAGRKVLFCTGYDQIPHRQIDAFLDELSSAPLEHIYLADGYGDTCELRQVLTWRGK